MPGLSKTKLTLIALICAAASSLSSADERGFGFRLSDFSISDDVTEAQFNVDSGPIPQVFFRYQARRHAIVASLGFKSWSARSGGTTSDLDFVPLAATYRFVPWFDRTFSFFVGGGASTLIYEGTVESGSSLTSEIAAATALEPEVGFEVLANRRVRFSASAKYSWQLFTTGDLDLNLPVGQPLDVDMSGLYVSAGVSFMFGGSSSTTASTQGELDHD